MRPLRRHCAHKCHQICRGEGQHARRPTAVWPTPKLYAVSAARRLHICSASRHPEAFDGCHTLIISSSSALCAMCSIATVSAGSVGAGYGAPFSGAVLADASAAGSAAAAADAVADPAACVPANVALAPANRDLAIIPMFNLQLPAHGICNLLSSPRVGEGA